MPGLKIDLVVRGLDEQIARINQVEGAGGFATARLMTGMRAAVVVAQNRAAVDMSAVAAENLSSMMGGIGGEMTPLAPANPVTPKRVLTHDVLNKGPMNIEGRVYSKVRRYMATAQSGRGAGKRPPIAAMQKWVENVMGISHDEKIGRKSRSRTIARQLAMAIAEKGIRGTPTLPKTLAAVQGKIEDIFMIELDRICAALAITSK